MTAMRALVRIPGQYGWRHDGDRFCLYDLSGSLLAAVRDPTPPGRLRRMLARLLRAWIGWGARLDRPGLVEVTDVAGSRMATLELTRLDPDVFGGRLAAAGKRGAALVRDAGGAPVGFIGSDSSSGDPTGGGSSWWVLRSADGTEIGKTTDDDSLTADHPGKLQAICRWTTDRHGGPVVERIGALRLHRARRGPGGWLGELVAFETGGNDDGWDVRDAGILLSAPDLAPDLLLLVSLLPPAVRVLHLSGA